jgi:Domain of unknown function (DUF929)
MGKAERIRQNNARARIAAQQAAARRAEARRRMLMASASVLAVIAIVVVIVVVHAAGNNKAAAAGSGGTGTTSTAAAVTKDLANVPAATLNSVGTGSGVAKLIATSGQKPLTANGKPEIIYVGAEYCPYCAAERWAMTVALSRFGTFTNLRLIHSSSTDVYANTPTLSFYHSTYTSKYLTFSPDEWYSDKQLTQGDGYSVLQAPSALQTVAFDKYDAPPYITSADKGSFPFVDIGNQYLVIGAQYTPSTLSGLSWTQVAADVANPSSAVAKDIDGAANSITAAICKITHNSDAAVCNSAAVTAGAGNL